MASGEKKYYNVYDNGKLFLSCATRKQIKSKIGIDQPAAYAANGWKIKNRYIIRFCKEKTEKEKRYRNVRTVFTKKMFDEWDAMNKRYGTIYNK